jgi:antitoxin component YwqK of YwqJK toxin-antitoxin module
MGESLVGDYINYYYSQSEFNGQIKDKCCYEDGKKNGEYIKYHENGKIKAKGNYENNYLVGYEYRYDIDGNLIEKFLLMKMKMIIMKMVNNYKLRINQILLITFIS